MGSFLFLLGQVEVALVIDLTLTEGGGAPMENLQDLLLILAE